MRRMDEVWAWPAARQAAAIRTGELSSRELLDVFLDRIAELNPRLNAVVTLDADRAREEAARCDDEQARGRLRGALHGLPATVKDAIEVAGMRATGGSPDLSAYVPERDAPAVARLRDAGAVIFGKTNVPLWSGDVQTFNDLFGTTNNPWGLDRTPGGSSGGAAAAVACGLTAFELGTDIGGSVRFPSHFCGVYGLKTSVGVVSQRGYLDHVGGGAIDADINVFGPLARSAEDLELLLGVVAGPPPEQAPAWRLELPAARVDSLQGLRVGVWLDEPTAPLDRASRDVLRAAVDAMDSAGARVAEAHPPVEFVEQVALFNQLIMPAIATSFGDERGRPLAGSHYDWLALQRRRAQLRRTWAEWFAGFDVLLCPVTVTAAFPHTQEGTFMDRTLQLDIGERPYADLTHWTGLIGVVDLPSAVPPVGRTADGLPVGIQVVAPYLHDRTAAVVAGAIGEVCGGYEPPPLAR